MIPSDQRFHADDIAAVRAAGFRAMPLPGASSVTAALSVAGLAMVIPMDWVGQWLLFSLLALLFIH